jgi:myosin-5
MIEALISFLNAQAAQLNFFVGSHVWVEDPDVAWIDGEILESKDQEITISNESGTKVSLLESICISLHVILDFVYITLF